MLKEVKVRHKNWTWVKKSNGWVVALLPTRQTSFRKFQSTHLGIFSTKDIFKNYSDPGTGGDYAKWNKQRGKRELLDSLTCEI